ncbi:hypothetical protein [Virgibacillus dokdonensis]|uniref:Uncharacterized protein n=1 Tax=Virgibacillus dokdonensis TaxID=302167 RepID=A0A2K9IZH4_9BACI|nr:hypothetical protein [Virgibacillus dokdonensis]AUJ23151.1 hypothetical protein A21D_00035 [Virgibacillus dokdonensis]
MNKTFISEPAEVIPKVIKVINMAEKHDWDENDLYCIAKVILAHFESDS